MTKKFLDLSSAELSYQGNLLLPGSMETQKQHLQAVYSHGDIQRITEGEKKKSESFISRVFSNLK